MNCLTLPVQILQRVQLCDVLSLFYFVNRKLEVQLPRFQLDRSYTLRDALQSLDITKVFQDDAEIINMGTKGPKLEQVTSCYFTAVKV